VDGAGPASAAGQAILSFSFAILLYYTEAARFGVRLPFFVNKTLPLRKKNRGNLAFCTKERADILHPFRRFSTKNTFKIPDYVVIFFV
jgi:hypothetical protein